MRQSKIEFLIEELLEFGVDPRFRQELKVILSDIAKDNCIINIIKIRTSSYYITSNSGNEIVLSLDENYGNPINIIFALLHEWGHHHCRLNNLTSYIKNDRLEVLQEEEKAWDFALEKLRSSPILSDHEEQFQEHRQKCLETYYKDSKDHLRSAGKLFSNTFIFSTSILKIISHFFILKYALAAYLHVFHLLDIEEFFKYPVIGNSIVAMIYFVYLIGTGKFYSTLGRITELFQEILLSFQNGYRWLKSLAARSN